MCTEARPCGRVASRLRGVRRWILKILHDPKRLIACEYIGVVVHYCHAGTYSCGIKSTKTLDFVFLRSSITQTLMLLFNNDPDPGSLIPTP